MNNLFSHRLASNNDGDINDAINASADRAIGVLNILWAQFEENSGRMNDKIIRGALDSIECEVRDMKNLSNLSLKQKNTD